MSDRPDDKSAPASDTSASGEPPEAALAEQNSTAVPDSPASAPLSRYREMALGLAGVLVLVVLLVGTAPFWAASLPWGSATSGDTGAITARIEQLEATQRQTLARLDPRVAALETKPAAMPAELADLRQQIAKLSAVAADLVARLDRVDKAAQALNIDLVGRLDAVDRALRSRETAATELANRVQALEKAAQTRAGDMTDMGLTLALLQIGSAVQVGRPFAAEYDAFAALAGSRPEIAAAAAPLAEPAKTGVAGRPVLVQQLRALDRKIADAPRAAAAAQSERGWTDAALDRLRGLVTIRRVGAVPPDKGPEAPVVAAARAMAGGDLAAAVAEIEKLQGAPAEIAAPWLRMARQLLTVETALQQVEALLSARLGGPVAAPRPPG